MSHIYYRTKDGLEDYGFSIEQQSDGNYRIYMTSMPSYGDRDRSIATTHRYKDGDRHYICWTEPLRTEEDAKEVAALWADKTQEYIKYGTKFS